MKQRLSFALVALGLAFAGGAQAQFKTYEAPSAIRADNAKAMNGNTDANLPPEMHAGIRPLSPLGGHQGTPLTIQPIAPMASVNGYTGTSSGAPVPIGGPVDLNGKPLPDDPSVDDPTKVRKPLQPKTIQKGVAPR